VLLLLLLLLQIIRWIRSRQQRSAAPLLQCAAMQQRLA
jgi:hypothetical protein